MGSIITKDDRPISWTPLSPERSTGASMTHNNTLQKQWILKGRHFGGGGEDGSLQSSYYTFTLNLSLSVRWAPSPLLTQRGSIQERIRVGEKLHRCHNMIKKKKKDKKWNFAIAFILPAHCHTPPSPLNGPVQKSHPSGRSRVKAPCFDWKRTACYFTHNCNCQQLTSDLEEQ